MTTQNRWSVVFTNTYKDHSIKVAISLTPVFDTDVEIEALNMLANKHGLDVSKWVLFSAEQDPNQTTINGDI